MAKPYFPQDLFDDILIHLPVKSLVRFKSVSNSWRSFIDSTPFIKRHLNRSVVTNSNLRLILADYYVWAVDFNRLRKAIRLDCSFKSPDHGTVVVGSCNGLLCIAKSENDVALWNPLTRQYHALPLSLGFVSPNFKIVWCSSAYAFGYDPINDDYKVLKLLLMYGPTMYDFDCEVQLYSLISNSWMLVGDVDFFVLSFLCDPSHSYAYNQRSGICVGGALNWVVNLNNFPFLHTFIITFDFKDGKFHHMTTPDFGHEEDFEANAAVLDTKFCLMCNHSKVQVDLWLMMEYGVKESWVKLYTIIQDRPGHLTPFAYSKSRDKLLLEQNGKKLVWYDLRNQSLGNVTIRGAPRSFGVALLYQGSLVSPNVGGERDGKKQNAHEDKTKKDRRKRDDFLSTGFKLKL